MTTFRTLLLSSILIAATACSGTRTPAPSADTSPAEPLINGGLEVVEITDTLSPAPPIVPVSVEEERRRFVLQPGYRMEPVLTEPTIREPAAIAFDGNGRMFVLELRTYMQDADATAELEPGNRISLHEDTDGDGSYDRHTVFVDSLVFPRFVLPFGANSIPRPAPRTTLPQSAAASAVTGAGSCTGSVTVKVLPVSSRPTRRGSRTIPAKLSRWARSATSIPASLGTSQ